MHIVRGEGFPQGAVVAGGAAHRAVDAARESLLEEGQQSEPAVGVEDVTVRGHVGEQFQRGGQQRQGKGGGRGESAGESARVLVRELDQGHDLFRRGGLAVSRVH